MNLFSRSNLKVDSSDIFEEKELFNDIWEFKSFHFLSILFPITERLTQSRSTESTQRFDVSKHPVVVAPESVSDVKAAHEHARVLTLHNPDVGVCVQKQT